MRTASALDAFLARGDFMRARVSLALLSLRENEELLVVYQPPSYLLLGKLRTLTVKNVAQKFHFLFLLLCNCSLQAGGPKSVPLIA